MNKLTDSTVLHTSSALFFIPSLFPFLIRRSVNLRNNLLQELAGDNSRIRDGFVIKNLSES